MTSTDLTHSDICRILELVNSAGNLEEFDLTVGDTRIRLGRNELGAVETSVTSSPPATSVDKMPVSDPQISQAPLAAQPAVVQPAAVPPVEEVEIPTGQIAVRAPMMGVFYRAPAPGEPAFVEVGTGISDDETLCLLEIMKLFKPFSAGVKGTIKSILPENGALVEYDQILFLVEPD